MENLLTEINFKNHLGYGDLKEVMNKSKASRTQINRVLEGKSFNDKVLNAIAEVIEEKRARREQSIKRIKQAIS